jgi:hypothetical protein
MVNHRLMRYGEEMARTDPQVAIRLPPDVKRFIKAEAKFNASSQNSEIVRCIRERMERMKAKGPAEAATSPSHGSNDPR